MRSCILIHGGPGAAGYLGPVAARLKGSFRVLEPHQRHSGAVPLTVATHVEDLRELAAGCEPRPALLGHSWGAMLALAFAAAHPELPGPIVLAGCGTFDQASRAEFRKRVESRLTDELRQRLAAPAGNPDEQLRARGEALIPAYSFDLAEEPARATCDAVAHDESWADMLRLQESGIYPAAFAAIRSPALMLHGADDPHPGRQIFASLRPHIPRIEYHELARCGHYPWLEREAREEFFSACLAWLGQ